MKLLTTVSQVVESAIYGEDSLSDSLEKIGNDDEVEYDCEDEDWEATSDGHVLAPMKPTGETLSVLRRDLRVVKDAGFKLGYLGIATGSIIIAVSCRVSRLGISEDAMQAWDVKPSEYLVLLLRYPSAYRSLEELLCDVENRLAQLQIYVGLCDSYKPSHEDAVRVFQSQTAEQQQSERPAGSGASGGASGAGIRRLFIDRAINSLLNERLLAIISYRLKFGLSWTGAELCAHQFQGKPSNSEDQLSDEYFEPDSWSSATPDLLMADHVVDGNLDKSQLSLPLLAMQFTLRHFVKCTEFCLVCHCRVSADFEALKPYVCSNSLCLYQYMALGMGPSLEYEILSQPHVVDMLISLTYCRAKSGRLEDFPTGLGMKVPGGIGWTTKPYVERNYYNPPDQQPASKPKPTATLYTAELDPANLELRIDGDERPPLRVGDWIAITEFEGNKDTDANNTNFNSNNIFPYSYMDVEPTGQGQWHSRVRFIDDRIIHLSSPINYGDLVAEIKKGGSKKGKKNTVQAVEFVIYDQNFDNLDDNEKRGVIPLILNTLPSLEAMTQYLSMASAGGSLALWKDLISPAALDILRWIVASNRSFIMLDGDDNPEHLVPQMDGYVQFRLVQGAPDKEQKFESAVRKHTANPKHPSIFTWHGSPLCNWHSILREGLNFKYTANGRSHGHGVYMARDFTTSTGYCHQYAYKAYKDWPQSKLKISMVISLNEVVNAPARFVHASSFYVVNQVDWIQPRYLFVKCEDAPSTSKAPGSSLVYEQDSALAVVGPTGHNLALPMSKLGGRGQQLLQMPKMDYTLKVQPAKKPSAKRAAPKSTAKKSKRRRMRKNDSEPEPEPEPKPELEPGIPLVGLTAKDDDTASIATLYEDLEILLSDVEDEEPVEFIPKTDFVPGTLDESTLPILNHPKHASSSATKALQQQLKVILETQDKEYPGALGWYVDPKLINTVYQWIVELHSFDPALPLAQDLKNANLKSVVLELRFPPKFPHAPPFVRVIRPRFLPFQDGGGGHVTAGGAMCMELLTNTGWLPTATIESVLLQVRMALCSQDPAPARLSNSRIGDYTAAEAVQAYKRACQRHGWGVPDNLDKVSWS